MTTKSLHSQFICFGKKLTLLGFASILMGSLVLLSAAESAKTKATLFTGRSPVEISMSRFSAPLPRSVKTYPEALRAAGWFTGVAGRTYHMDGESTAMQEWMILQGDYMPLPVPPSKGGKGKEE